MHHTIHLFQKLNGKAYSILFEALREISRKNHSKYYKDANGRYYFELFQANGLTLFMRQTTLKSGRKYHAIELIMNPIRLLEPEEYITLADTSKAYDIYNSFEKLLAPLMKEIQKKQTHYKLQLDLLDAYSVKRIDFAINFRSEHANYYMELIKRANIPNGFALGRKYDDRSKRQIPYKHSFYLLKIARQSKKRSITINCYNKTQHLREEKLPFRYDGYDTIRFEVQCGYNKVYRLIKDDSAQLSKNNYAQWLREDISIRVLLHYYKKSIGLGNYYTFPEAKRRISNLNDVSYKKKEKLVRTLEVISEKRGIWKARQHSFNKVDFDKLVNDLLDIGINPVTIPLNWKVSYLPNLYVHHK